MWFPLLFLNHSFSPIKWFNSFFISPSQTFWWIFDSFFYHSFQFFFRCRLFNCHPSYCNFFLGWSFNYYALILHFILLFFTTIIQYLFFDFWFFFLNVTQFSIWADIGFCRILLFNHNTLIIVTIEYFYWYCSWSFYYWMIIIIIHCFIWAYFDSACCFFAF